MLLQLFVIDNCIGDWRIAMSFRSTAQILVELLVCSIHPVPGSFYFTWRMEHANDGTVTTALVPVDLILSLPMFLRLYLVCRGTTSHSFVTSVEFIESHHVTFTFELVFRLAKRNAKVRT